jgi:hypothetical protein
MSGRVSTGYIYFFVDEVNKQVKIGFSKSPTDRLKTVQTSYPGTLVIKKTIRGSQRDERQYHRIFCRSKIKREWFFLSEEIKSFLER